MQARQARIKKQLQKCMPAVRVSLRIINHHTTRQIQTFSGHEIADESLETIEHHS